jgi:menaquinol-cytochrome c reductase iron-sulfur subunit
VRARRGFLAKAAALALGSVAYLVPVAGGLVALLNPLRQKGAGGDFLRLAFLDAVPEDGTPRMFPVVTERVDAWTRSIEPVGGVYLRRTEGNQVEALQVVCPHAGCTVEYKNQIVDEKTGDKVAGFLCPCHRASFDVQGRRLEEVSESPRDLDKLEVELRNGTEVWVRFQQFQRGTPKKIPQA